MSNENKWEYDYSNIYHKPSEPSTSGYANVGSSGTNVANQTMQDDYSSTPSYAQSTTADATQHATTSDTDTSYRTQYQAGGYQPNTGMGGGTPPRYDSTPPTGTGAGKRHTAQQPSMWKTVAYRTVALVTVATVGFAGGYVGSQYGGATQDKNVFVQQVTRDTSNVTSISTSTDGNDLSFVSASALASPSVVVITTEQMVATSGWYGTQSVESGAGSGVIISEDGYILTCAHVVADSTHVVVTIDDKDYAATIVGSDTETDVAVIKIDATGLTPAVMGDSDALAVGETVLAVGNPLGELGGSVTQGIVSALNRVIVVENSEMTLIQMDASVSPGNSGGGLFNMAGELVGIVNAKSNDTDSEGIGFSIPINTAFGLAQSLIENGYITGRPELGVVAVNIGDAETAMMYGVNALGIYVYSINEGSAAEKAGLQVADRLISIEDTEISALSDLTSVIDAHEVGDTVNLLVAREGQMLTVAVTLGEQGAPSEGASTFPEQGTSEPDMNAQTPDDSVMPPQNGQSDGGFTSPFDAFR